MAHHLSFRPKGSASVPRGASEEASQAWLQQLEPRILTLVVEDSDALPTALPFREGC